MQYFHGSFDAAGSSSKGWVMSSESSLMSEDSILSVVTEDSSDGKLHGVGSVIFLRLDGWIVLTCDSVYSTNLPALKHCLFVMVFETELNSLSKFPCSSRCRRSSS